MTASEAHQRSADNLEKAIKKTISEVDEFIEHAVDCGYFDTSHTVAIEHAIPVLDQLKARGFTVHSQALLSSGVGRRAVRLDIIWKDA